MIINEKNPYNFWTKFGNSGHSDIHRGRLHCIRGDSIWTTGTTGLFVSPKAMSTNLKARHYTVFDLPFILMPERVFERGVQIIYLYFPTI